MPLFETHITCLIKDAEKAQKVADAQGWKTSQIARDIALGDDTYFYLTSHGRNIAKVTTKLDHTVAFLKAFGVEVVREKIELIIHDTKLHTSSECQG